MKRLVAPTLLVAVLTALLPSPAVAGGNFLEFRLRGAVAGSDPPGGTSSRRARRSSLGWGT
jgi:hypothetical protein